MIKIFLIFLREFINKEDEIKLWQFCMSFTKLLNIKNPIAKGTFGEKGQRFQIKKLLTER